MKKLFFVCLFITVLLTTVSSIQIEKEVHFKFYKKWKHINKFKLFNYFTTIKELSSDENEIKKFNLNFIYLYIFKYIFVK